MIGHSLGAYRDVFWPEHPRCRDPISKHISNPDFTPKKRGRDVIWD